MPRRQSVRAHSHLNTELKIIILFFFFFFSALRIPSAPHGHNQTHPSLRPSASSSSEQPKHCSYHSNTVHCSISFLLYLHLCVIYTKDDLLQPYHVHCMCCMCVVYLSVRCFLSMEELVSVSKWPS